MYSSFFFFNDTATTEIYTLSLHDALPILVGTCRCEDQGQAERQPARNTDRRDSRGYTEADEALAAAQSEQDRKSTRLNSSHGYISYAVFCLKKKKITKSHRLRRSDVAPTV